ncbi:hypothetical protein Vretifemale_2116, partial [Volvox reticuliferus]
MLACHGHLSGPPAPQDVITHAHSAMQNSFMESPRQLGGLNDKLGAHRGPSQTHQSYASTEGEAISGYLPAAHELLLRHSFRDNEYSPHITAVPNHAQHGQDSLSQYQQPPTADAMAPARSQSTICFDYRHVSAMAPSLLTAALPPPPPLHPSARHVAQTHPQSNQLIMARQNSVSSDHLLSSDIKISSAASAPAMLTYDHNHGGDEAPSPRPPQPPQPVRGVLSANSMRLQNDPFLGSLSQTVPTRLS